MSARRPRRRPFGPTTNLNAYVPRHATERCLADLARSIRVGDRRTVLVGPPGLGKTLLVHLLADRLGHELRFVHLPHGDLSPEELCAWALGRLLLPQSEQPVAALCAHARRRREEGSGLLVLIDDAESMPVETAECLALLARDPEAGLRLVFAVTEGTRADEVLRALGADVDLIQLRSPMTPEETAEYVTARLERNRVRKTRRRRFDAETIDKLHRAAGGNPRQVDALATAVLDGAPASLLDDILEEGKEEAGLPSLDAGDLPPLPEGWETASPPGAASDTRSGPREAEPGAVAGGDAVPEHPSAALRPPAASVRPPTAVAVFATAAAVAAAAIAVALLRPVGQLSEAASRPPPAPARETARAPEVAGAPEPDRTGAVRGAGRVARAGPFPVQVNATPWARIEVDGVDFGPTPLSGIPLLAGPHRFRARMPDGRVVERVVEIDAGNRFVGFE